MYRVRSTDLWYNAPGVVAAYQPIAAPDPFAARQNVSNDARRAGVYMATDTIAAPAWSSANGWTFTASKADALSTGFVVPSSMKFTFAIQVYKSTPWEAWNAIFGTSGNAYQKLGVSPGYDGATLAYIYGALTSGWAVSPVLPVGAHHLAMSGYTGWRDGKQETTLGGHGYNTINLPLYIGGRNGAAPEYTNGTVRSFAIWRRVLSAGEMTEVARQMAYCHVNHNWSAWGRRRQYYYAPSAAAAALWRGVGRNSSPVGGSLGIGRTP